MAYLLALATQVGFSLAMIFTGTAYCDSGVTASGRHTTPGAVAVDPHVIPLGSKLLVNGHRKWAIDTGGYVHGRHVDIWMPSCSEARRYGVREVVVHILRWGKGHA